MFETKIGQIGLPKRSNRVVHWYRVLSPTRADSRSENSDSISNNINNHNPKTNTGRKLK